MLERNEQLNTLPRNHEDLGDGTVVVTNEFAKFKKPPLYKVVLHNDDYTPMDFVVSILEGVFHQEPAAAVNIMLDVHKKGYGLCGIYPYGVAETKVSLVTHTAQDNMYPLKCTMEKE